MERIKGCEGAFQIVNKGMCFLGFDNYIVDISLDETISYLVVEAGLYSALVGSPTFLSPNDMVV